jgi:DNA polymerase-1
MVLTALEETRLLGLDIETTGLNPCTDRIRLLTLDCDTTDGERFTYVIDTFAVNPSPLFEVLAEKEIITHNGAFDLGFLARLGFASGTIHDTMLSSLLIHGTRKARGFHTLEECARRELGRELNKEEQRSDWSGSLTPEQLRYAAEDAAVLLPLHRALAAKIQDARLEKVAGIEGRFLRALVWMSGSGVAFDEVAWSNLVEAAQAEAWALGERLDALAPQTAKTGLFGINWDSPEQVKAVFRSFGVELDSTDDEHLAAVDHPLAETLRDYRAAKKRCTTYGWDWLKHVASDGRVYAGWRQIGADSGRMACCQPNLQNLPRDPLYRMCFVAPPGRVLVKGDYSQIELRIAAKIAGEERMVEAYRRGDDLHTLTARMILGKQEVRKTDRQLAKAVNFGLLYGMGASGFRAYARTQYGLELTEKQAQDYRAAFFKAYPGLARWHRSIPRSAVETRTLLGRRRLNVERFTEKLNTPVQGTGADGLKLALALLLEQREEVPGAFPVLAVHDEIVVECDREQVGAVEVRLRRAMVEGMAPLIEPVPVEVDVSVGPTWGG